MRPLVKLKPPHACTFKLRIDQINRNQEKKKKKEKSPSKLEGRVTLFISLENLDACGGFQELTLNFLSGPNQSIDPLESFRASGINPGKP